jgi:o-succinylbenzoate synthase
MAIQLQRLVLREIRLPLKAPFRISSGVVSERRITLLTLEGGDGVESWSECVAGEQPNYSAETIDTAWLAIREWLAPRVLGERFGHPREVSAALERGVRGHAMAKAAVEMGCWALAAESAGLPLARVLGGNRTEVATGVSLGIQARPAELVAEACAAAQLGYRKIKLKIAPGSDLEFVAAVREELGREAQLMVDANSAYTLDQTDHLARLDAFHLIMIEQPLAPDDLVRHARLQRRLTTPICLDESITGPDRAEDMITLGSGRVINIKPGRVGGYGPSLDIHEICHCRDVPVWCGGMLESGVGRAYNVALASLPGFTLPGDLSPSDRYWERDIVSPAWTMDARGMVRVPDSPGLGVRVDQGRVEDLTVRLEVLTA